LYREAVVQENRKALTFLADVPHGNYLVSVIIANKEPGLSVPGDLRVVADSDAPVKLTAIHPLTQYPSAKHGNYDLLLVGENFARNPEDNIIEVEGRGPENTIPSADCDSDKEFANQQTPPERHRPCLQVIEIPKTNGIQHEGSVTERELRLVGFHPDKYIGSVNLRVRTGRNNVSLPVKVTLSRITAPFALLATLVIFFVMTWIVIRLVSLGVKQYRIGGQAYGPFVGFLLDKETNSFSLSKFQLLAWTAVSVFGYLYLFVCRVLIQSDFAFPPIPDNFPQLLAISAGTTVAATGITTAMGSKGAGDILPSFFDFISSGGLVVSERFQFFVWTLVGCLGFISLLLIQDPSTVTDMPKVPEGFLYLMGISSAGYLGGKMVRKAGPVVKLLAVTKVAKVEAEMPASAPPASVSPRRFPVLVINLKGENFGTDAKLQVDGKMFDRADDFWVTGTPDPQTGFCSEVNVGINDAQDKGYLEGEHTLSFINKDGQASSVIFPVDALKIDAITNVPAGGGKPAHMKVTGSNFVTQGMRFEWRSPASAVAATAQNDIPGTDVVSATELIVPVSAAMVGAGKLTLISATQLRASKEFTIA